MAVEECDEARGQAEDLRQVTHVDDDEGDEVLIRVRLGDACLGGSAEAFGRGPDRRIVLKTPGFQVARAACG